LSALAGAAPVAAQGRAPIETDRPDFTESSATVPRGRYQLEAGYTVQRAAQRGSSHSLPETLLRIGVSSGVELRLAQNAMVADGASAFDDIAIGTKLALGGQRGARPELALLLQTTLPTGGTRVSAAVMQPSAALLAGWELGGAWSAGGSLIAGRERDDHLELAASTVVGYELSPTWRSYAEWFTIQPVHGNAGERGESYLNGGLTRLLSPTLQLDARVGLGVGGGADRFFMGVGLSVGW
jgi:hypothetical protein